MEELFLTFRETEEGLNVFTSAVSSGLLFKITDMPKWPILGQPAPASVSSSAPYRAQGLSLTWKNEEADWVLQEEAPTTK